MPYGVQINLVAIKVTVTIGVFCEPEARYAIDGVPLCGSAPADLRVRLENLKTDRHIRTVLEQEIVASTARAHAASKELVAIMGDIPSGLPQPDGAQRIQNAARALAAARNEVMQAHSRLDEFLARGIVPADWKPGGPA
jgi:hypothetical protein